MSDQQNVYDVFVIGGGVNGTGIAADAAGRGLSVLLCEQNDLASATSSNSSKLIHGGLRYLEHYEFRLVKEALAEREVLLNNAPHIMWPLRFTLPHRPHLRPAWMIRAGLFLYDNLAKRVTLPRSRGVKFDNETPLKAEMKKGFKYSDGWVDDARLVVLNALAAQQHGADVRTYTQCVRAERVTLDTAEAKSGQVWKVELQEKDSDITEVHYAKSLVNAGGPWVAKLFDNTIKLNTPKSIRLVKGSHIIVPKIHDQEDAYILQNEDERIVFVLPYENDFSLIGTTDVEYDDSLDDIKIDNDEVDYLIEVVNDHFKQQIKRSDIVKTYSGVRPLLEDESSSAQAVTRDYTMELNDVDGQAPILSIFGGKITTYRKLSEAAVDKVAPYFKHAKAQWTKHAKLPGGGFTSKKDLLTELSGMFPALPYEMLERYIRSYGTLSYKILHKCTSIESLGMHFGADLYECEVQYLMNHEWANNLEDVLWRRSKLGLKLSSQEQDKLEAYIASAYKAKRRGTAYIFETDSIDKGAVTADLDMVS